MTDSATTTPVAADGQPARVGGVLGEYRQRKLTLAQLIGELMTIARERHDDEREAAARDLLARLADDAFQLAVVGQFSRGKSTLMNAILGGPYLPTGALPMTSVLTTVRYGSEPRAWVRRTGSDLEIDVPLDQLVRYVAQHSGERQELQIAPPRPSAVQSAVLPSRCNSSRSTSEPAATHVTPIASPNATHLGET